MRGSRIFSPNAPGRIGGALAGLIITCTVVTTRAQERAQSPSAAPVTAVTPAPTKVPPPAPKPTPKPEIVTRSVNQLSPDLEFVFTTNVPTIPVVYVSKRELNGYHPTDPANLKFIVGSKGSPLGTSHKIHVVLPKRAANYFFLVFISYIDPKTKKKEYLPLWDERISVSLPSTF
jgi:hypothetical protein